jgi:hypothetical protein
LAVTTAVRTPRKIAQHYRASTVRARCVPRGRCGEQSAERGIEGEFDLRRADYARLREEHASKSRGETLRRTENRTELDSNRPVSPAAETNAFGARVSIVIPSEVEGPLTIG